MRSVILLFKLLCELDIIKTIYINIKTQPIAIALKLPIFIFKNTKIHSLRGKIVIDSKIIKSGFIKIGYKYLDLFPCSYIKTQLSIDGTLILKGPLIASGGVHLCVEDKSNLELGKNCTIGGGTFIKSTSEIIIGNNTRITGNCMIMDSNMHYTKDITTGIITKKWGKIIIGKNCWINFSSVITKGANIPDYSIIARGSFLNKDYSSNGTNLFLVGSPAIVSKRKVQRIFSLDKERALNDYFMKNTDALEYLDEPGIFDDESDFLSIRSQIMKKISGMLKK